MTTVLMKGLINFASQREKQNNGKVSINSDLTQSVGSSNLLQIANRTGFPLIPI